jgi:hypothetical protein
MIFDKVSGMFYGLLIGEKLGLINFNKSEYIDSITEYRKLSLPIKCMFEICFYTLHYKTYDRNVMINKYFNIININDPTYYNLVELRNESVKTNIHPMMTEEYDKMLSRLFHNNKLQNTSESMIRCLPLLIFDKQDILIDSYLTNPHNDCIECNFIYIKILQRCLNDEPIDVDVSWTKNMNVKKIIKMAKNNIMLDLNYIENNCYNTLFCLLYVYLYFNRFDEGIKWVIKNSSNKYVYHNSSVAGCVLGAKLSKKLMDEKTTYDNMTFILNHHENDKYILYLETFVNNYSQLLKNKI